MDNKIGRVSQLEDVHEFLWLKLWNTIDDDEWIRDEVWGMLVAKVPGMPDYRVKEWTVTIPLQDSITVTVDARNEEEAIELATDEVTYQAIEDVILESDMIAESID